MRNQRSAARWCQRLTLPLVLSGLLALTACGATPQQPATAQPPSPPAYPAPPSAAPTGYPALSDGAGATPTILSTIPPTISPRPPATPVPAVPSPVPAATPATPAGSGEVPATKLAAAVADLARRTGADPAQIVVVSAEAVTWSDGSLGCPQPGMFYPQVLIDGYRLVLEVNGVRYSYHAAADGEFFYCERPAQGQR